MLTTDPATRDFVGLTSTDRTGIRHLPGLDGLRGLAVLVVVAFHAGFENMVGGYLGVSTFFTLSGFLITSLLLNEADRTGSVAVRSFWGRRFRRLLPAALATLAAVVLLFTPFVATADQRASMRGNVLASLFDVANWHDIIKGNSYADLFTAPSPVLHFWSLSIEEQFYVVFPILLLGIWIATRGRRGLLAATLGTLAIFSVLEPFVFSMSDDRVYFGTDTRAAELLLGSLLAVLLAHEPFRRKLALRLRWRSAAIWAGAIALVVQAWWWWSLPQTTSWLYRGGFAFYALLTCAVVIAAALPSGPMRSVMSWSVLRWFGGLSYGIYLIHWPMFLTVRQLWPDIGRWPQTIVAVGITIVLALGSYHFIEQPIRLRRWPSHGRGLLAGAVCMSLVAAIAFIPFPVNHQELTQDLESQKNSYEAFAREQSKRPTTTTTTVVPTPPVAKVAVFGDSTALAIGMGFGGWSTDTGTFGALLGDAKLGCPVARFDAIKPDTVLKKQADCAAWPERWAQQVALNHPDIAVLASAVWELPDALLPDATKWSAIGDPKVDEFIRNEFIIAADALSSQGALVVLVTWPHFGTWNDVGKSDAARRHTQPARMDRFNEILREVAAARPDTVQVIDLAGYLGDRSQDRSLRPDGTHFQTETFHQLSGEWFGPELNRIWHDWWMTHRAPGTPGATATAGPTTTTAGATGAPAAPTTTVRPTG